MNLGKAPLLCCLSLAAIVLAVPSIASATWTHDHEEIAESPELHFQGVVGFENGPNSIECVVTATITAEAGTTTGQVTQFNLGHHNECSNTINACRVEEAMALNLPWTVHILTPFAAPPTLYVTNVELLTKFTKEGNCNWASSELKIAEVTAVPDSSKTINSLTLASQTGSLTINLVPSGSILIGAQATGELVPTDLSTWGIS